MAHVSLVALVVQVADGLVGVQPRVEAAKAQIQAVLGGLLLLVRGCFMVLDLWAALGQG